MIVVMEWNEQAGKFSEEVVPVEVKSGKGVVTVTEDEEFKKAKLDKIPTLKPAFKPEGGVCELHS